MDENVAAEGGSPAPGRGSKQAGAGSGGTDAPRCDYLRRPSDPSSRCPQLAIMQVLFDQGAGREPLRRERCAVHAYADRHARMVAAWDVGRGEWVQAG